MADNEQQADVPEQSTTASIRESLHATSVSIVGLFAIAIVAVVYLLKPVLLPLVLAMLLAAVFQPVVVRLHRIGIPRTVSAAVILGTLFLGSALAVWNFSDPVSDWMSRVPAQLRQAEWRLRELMVSLEVMDEVAEQVDAIGDDDDGSPSEATVKVKGPALSDTLMSSARDSVAYFALTLVLLYFVIGYGHHISERLRERLGGRDLVVEITESISSYLFTVTVINAGLGIAVATAMWLVGMPHPGLWGVMAFFFNYVPWVGAVVGIALIAFVSILTFDAAVERLLPPLAFFLLTSFEANFATPTILGHRFPINPVVLFVWVIFCGWLWGVAGAIIAVPLLMAFRLTCTYFPRMEFIGSLIGEAPTHEPRKKRRQERQAEEKNAT